MYTLHARRVHLINAVCNISTATCWQTDLLGHLLTMMYPLLTTTNHPWYIWAAIPAQVSLLVKGRRK